MRCSNYRSPPLPSILSISLADTVKAGQQAQRQCKWRQQLASCPTQGPGPRGSGDDDDNNDTINISKGDTRTLHLAAATVSVLQRKQKKRGAKQAKRRKRQCMRNTRCRSSPQHTSCSPRLPVPWPSVSPSLISQEQQQQQQKRVSTSADDRP